MTGIRLLAAIVSTLVIGLFTGCGGGSATVTPNIVNGGVTSRSFALIESPFLQWILPRVDVPLRTRPAALVGQTTAASITSLQYFVQRIELCENVTMSGTGYSGTSGCITLYSSPDTTVQEVSFYNTYTVTEAMADTNANHFIDFMTAEGRAKLATATSIDAGTYNYALLNFMRPIKIKAEFVDGGTSRFFTKAATGAQIVAGATDSGGRENEYIHPSTTTAGPAEVMTYMLNNGGVVVPLPTPFTIAAGENIFLDFVFNPIAFATASSQTSCASGGGTNPVFDETNCVTFNLPYAKMAPVPRKAGETTRKETYLVNYTTGASASKARVELYYNSADTTKAVRGIDVSVVMDTGATEAANNIISSYRATETAAGVVTLLGYNPATGGLDAESLTNLTRRAAGTATIKCANFAGQGPCPAATDVSAAYTYVGDFGIGS